MRGRRRDMRIIGTGEGRDSDRGWEGGMNKEGKEGAKAWLEKERRQRMEERLMGRQVKKG